MMQQAMNNAKVLYQLSVSKEDVETADRLYHTEPELKKVLASPIVPNEKKEKIIEQVFALENLPELLRNFLKVVCAHRQIDELDDIFKAYYEYWDEKHDILRAELSYAVKPEQTEIERAEKFLTKKYPGKQIIFAEKVDESLLGGMLIRIDNEEYDWSYDGLLNQLERKLTGR